MEASDGTANLFGLEIVLTASQISTIESKTRVTKLVFNEDSLDSVVARQLEPWLPRNQGSNWLP